VRVQRSVTEVLSKVRFKSVVQTLRLVRDVEQPFRELGLFLGVGRAPDHRRIRLRNGYQIHIDSVDEFRQSFWDCWVREPYRVLASDELIIDAGANIGCFSIYAVSKSLRGHVFALEPSSRNFRRLVDNIQLNRLDRRITALPVGVAGRSGTQELDVSHASPYHSVYTEVGPDRETIRVLSLSALLGEIGSPERVDLLKMDCEGGEMDCLLESSPGDLARIRRIAVEYHEWAGYSFPSLVERLRASGFTMRSHVRCEKDRTGVVEFVGP
jgi:FkbM family methyltransferase